MSTVIVFSNVSGGPPAADHPDRRGVPATPAAATGVTPRWPGIHLAGPGRKWPAVINGTPPVTYHAPLARLTLVGGGIVGAALIISVLIRRAVTKQGTSLAMAGDHVVPAGRGAAPSATIDADNPDPTPSVHIGVR